MIDHSFHSNINFWLNPFADFNSWSSLSWRYYKLLNRTKGSVWVWIVQNIQQPQWKRTTLQLLAPPYVENVFVIFFFSFLILKFQTLKLYYCKVWKIFFKFQNTFKILKFGIQNCIMNSRDWNIFFGFENNFRILELKKKCIPNSKMKKKIKILHLMPKGNFKIKIFKEVQKETTWMKKFPFKFCKCFLMSWIVQCLTLTRLILLNVITISNNLYCITYVAFGMRFAWKGESTEVF